MAHEISNLNRSISGVALYAMTVDTEKVAKIQKILDAAMAALKDKGGTAAREKKAYDFLEQLAGIKKGPV